MKKEYTTCYLPIALKITGRACLVVGGGDTAQRKIQRLVRFGANITVVAPTFNQTIKKMVKKGQISAIRANFAADQLADQCLVIAATDDKKKNEQIFALAQTYNIPVNVVDDPALCTFIMPSIIDRDPVFVAVSSGGTSPMLARLLRARLETYIPAAYGKLATIAAHFREQVRQRYNNIQLRRRFWEKALQGPVEEMVYKGQNKRAIKMLEHYLIQDDDPVDRHGEVYLVGAGPGDPDLLTFRALRLMQQAEVVLYDRLITEPILDLVRADAERLFVGKERDQHTVPQQEINQLLIDLASQGKRVLRLKGGDPFIFGRGGEEVMLLSSAGISFQIVPGVTAANGCASYAGIPLTHRDYAQSCLFVTGHLKDNNLSLNWDALVQPQQTIAIYMGIHSIPVLCDKLIDKGMAADMPAAIIEQGTTPRQRVYTGDIKSLPEIVIKNTIKPPSMIIIGEVVRLHKTLSWYRQDDI